MITKRISFAVSIAMLILATAAAVKYAQGLEWISAEAARRTIQFLIGLVLASYGNFMPKDIARSGAAQCAASRSQSALRVGGWSITLAGIAHAGLWAFAPIVFAHTAAIVVVAA